MQSFSNLRVWQEGHALALNVYRLTKAFPVEERFGLTSQLRRAAVSVVANVAEGSKRRHRTEFSRFLNIAEASVAEMECLLMLARDLELAAREACIGCITEAQRVGRQLHSLRHRVDADQTADRRPQTADQGNTWQTPAPRPRK